MDLSLALDLKLDLADLRRNLALERPHTERLKGLGTREGEDLRLALRMCIYNFQIKRVKDPLKFLFIRRHSIYHSLSLGEGSILLYPFPSLTYMDHNYQSNEVYCIQLIEQERRWKNLVPILNKLG